MEPRTDLAMEIREKFTQDNVEISGVELIKNRYENTSIEVTTVRILDDTGAKKMGKPVGTYVTIESPFMEYDDEEKKSTSVCLAGELKKLLKGRTKDGIFVAGLGNRHITPDMLGPLVTDNLFITRHIYKEMGQEVFGDNKPVKTGAIAPGVMSQTGVEAADILEGIVNDLDISCLIVIDALAARNVSRLNTTIQITDTGICPGSGVGNHRKGITKESLNIPVIAIGVPTVVDAFTIVNDSLRKYMGDVKVTGEIEEVINKISTSDTDNMIVTPRNIDEAVRNMAQVLSDALNSIISNEA